MEITLSHGLYGDALIKRRIPSAARQLIIQPLNVNHVWQEEPLLWPRVCVRMQEPTVNLNGCLSAMIVFIPLEFAICRRV